MKYVHNKHFKKVYNECSGFQQLTDMKTSLIKLISVCKQQVNCFIVEKESHCFFSDISAQAEIIN